MTRTRALLAALGLAAACASAPAFAAPQDGFETCAATYAEAGLPRRLGDDDAGETSPRCFSGFALSYNRRTRVPDWVIERLTPASFKGEATRRKSQFASDDAEPETARAELSDYEAQYQGRRFDRGHQAPAADAKFAQNAMDETFLLTNMAPQVGIGFNRHAWSWLEKAVRGWVLCGGRDVLYVMTGPVYAKDPDKVLGPNRIAIPDAFFKIVYDPARGRAIGFVLENKPHTGRALDPHRRTIASIEEATGIDFLTALNERSQSVLESHVSPMWAYDRSCDLRE